LREFFLNFFVVRVGPVSRSTLAATSKFNPADRIAMFHHAVRSRRGVNVAFA
jgi:hypothetical protein